MVFETVASSWVGEMNQSLDKGFVSRLDECGRKMDDCGCKIGQLKRTSCLENVNIKLDFLP